MKMNYLLVGRVSIYLLNKSLVGDNWCRMAKKYFPWEQQDKFGSRKLITGKKWETRCKIKYVPCTNHWNPSKKGFTHSTNFAIGL
jgi:hypothetical protein